MPPEPSNPPSQDKRLHQIIAAYLKALEEGKTVDRQKLLARFPDLASELQAFFTNYDQFQQVPEPQRLRHEGIRRPAHGEQQRATSERGLPPARPAPASGRSFGDYELLEEIGRGGMGVVYKARQKSLQREVAIKMILAGQLADDDEVKRFQREARVVAQLDHPNIVPIYEVGEHDGQHYFSMKLIAGQSLKHHLAHFQRKPRAAAQLLAQVARAVHVAHEQHILHRDLKPGNILLEAGKQPHVTDFGLAKRLDHESTLSPDGAVVGTASYMPPEQAAGRNQELSPAADVYSLGAVFYEMLTGRPPFVADNTLEILLQVMERDPDPPRKLNPKIPRDLETVCLKCLDKRAARRYPSAEALAEDLENWVAGRPIRGRRVGRAERVWLWCRRKPLLAALSATAVVLFVLVSVVAPLSFIYSGAAARAKQLQDDAEKEARRLRDESKAQLYRDDIRKAQTACEEQDFSRVRQLLNDYWPQPGETDHRRWEWFYLNALVEGQNQQQLIDRLSKQVTAASWSPDGQWLAVAFTEGGLTFWDTNTWQVKATFTTEPGQGLALAKLVWNPNSKRLAVIPPNSSPFVLDAGSGEKRYDLSAVDRPRLNEHGGPRLPQPEGPAFPFTGPRQLSWSPDGQRLVRSAPDGRSALVCDSLTGQTLFALPSRYGLLHLAVWSPDGKTIVTHGDEETLVFWDAQTGKETLTLPGTGSAGHHLAAWSSDEKHLAIYLRSKAGLGVFDAVTRRELRTLATGPYVTRYAWRPNRMELAVATSGSVQLWNVTTGQKQEVAGATDGPLVWSPDGQMLVLGNGQRGLRIWFADEQAIGSLPGINANGGSVAWKPDSRQLLGLNGQNDMVLGEPSTGQIVPTKLVKQQSVSAAWQWTKEGPQAALISEGRVEVCNAITGQTTVVVPKPGAGQLQPVTTLIAWSPDGQKLLTADSKGEVTVRNGATGETQFALPAPAQYPPPVWGPDGNRLAVAGLNDRGTSVITLRDCTSGRELRTLPNPVQDWQNYRPVLAWSPDGKQLACGAGRIRVWDVETGEEKWVLGDGTFSYGGQALLAWSKDGTRLISQSGPGMGESAQLWVWDVKLGKELLRLKGASANLLLNADGRWLFTGTAIKSVALPTEPIK